MSPLAYRTFSLAMRSPLVAAKSVSAQRPTALKLSAAVGTRAEEFTRVAVTRTRRTDCTTTDSASDSAPYTGTPCTASHPTSDRPTSR